MHPLDSKILPNGQAEILTAEKYSIYDEMCDAKNPPNDGQMQRLQKRAIDVQRQLDDDLNERRRNGFDEPSRSKAILAMIQSTGSTRRPMNGGPGRDELRELLTPGSPVKQAWVSPSAEQTMGRASEFARPAGAVYLTDDAITTGAAYFFLPELYKDILTGMLEASGVLEANPTLIVTNHLRPIQVPVLEADAVASAGTEGSAATETNTEGDVVTLGHFRYDGVFKIPIELTMSSEYNLDKLLSTFAARAIANQVAAKLALGDGVTEPQGLFTAGVVTPGVTTASATAATIDEVLQLTKALGKGYRKTSRMVASDVAHTAMLQGKNAEGDYVLRSVDGGGYEFAARPVYTEPWADQSGMSADEVHIVLGDFSGYFVRTTPMLFQRRDDDPLNPTFTFAVWMDAKLADTNALVSLKMHA